MIESVGRGRQIRYHKHKLVLIYSVMRHFALALREAGWDVWDFLDRNRETFAGNHRMGIVLKALAAKDPLWLARNREQAGSVREKLRKNQLI